MKIIRNQKGGVLPYVLMIMMVIMIFTPVLLSYGSNQQLSLINRENEKKAYMLAISGMEAFISYIKSFRNGDKQTYFNNYSGWGEYHITTPEGDTVVYRLTKTPPVNYVSIVTSTAEVGTGNQLKRKSVSYSFDLSPCQGPYITPDPNERKKVTEDINGIYVQGSANGIPNGIKVFPNSNLQNLIGSRMDQIYAEISAEINQYVSQAKKCDNCNEDQIKDMIRNSSSSPVFIKANNLSFKNNTTVTFGESTKPVILIVDNLTASNNVEINIYGTLIVLNSINANNNFTLSTKTASGSYGNLWVTGPISIDNNVNIDVASTLYTKSLPIKNNAHIKAKDLVIDGMLDMDNNAVLIANQDIFTRTFHANNNATITATGDLFVATNFEAKNNSGINLGGLLAVGGDVSFNNNPVILTGWGYTSLIVNPEDGGCHGNPNWKIGKVND